MDTVRVDRESSTVVTFTLENEAGLAIPLAQLTGAFRTLIDEETYDPGASPAVGVLNARDWQDILNAHDVTIHSTSGLVTWTMQPEDNLIVTPRRQVERHIATFVATWDGGQVVQPFEIDVRNTLVAP